MSVGWSDSPTLTLVNVFGVLGVLKCAKQWVACKAGQYSIGIVLPTQNWTILGFPKIGFTSQYNTNTIKKVVDEEEEEEENQKESSSLGQIDGP